MKKLLEFFKENPMYAIGLTWIMVSLSMHLMLEIFVDINIWPFMGMYAGSLGFLLAGFLQARKRRKESEVGNPV